LNIWYQKLAINPMSDKRKENSTQEYQNINETLIKKENWQAFCNNGTQDK